MLDKKHFKKPIDWSAQIMFLPAMIIIAGFTIYPIVWAFLSSFMKIPIMSLQQAELWEIPGSFVGLSNYIGTLKNDFFWNALKNTTWYGVMLIPSVFVGSLFLAILLHEKLRGTSFFRTVFFLPYVVSLVSASSIFLALFDGHNGMINSFLSLFGISGPVWLASNILAMPIIVLLGVWIKTGYYMLFFLAGLQSISDDYYEAARMDGANEWQQFYYITYPSLKPITIVVLVLLLKDVLNVFQEVYVMTGGGPANSTVTLPFLIYNEAFTYLRIGNAAATSFILSIIAIAIVALISVKNMEKA